MMRWVTDLFRLGAYVYMNTAPRSGVYRCRGRSRKRDIEDFARMMAASGHDVRSFRFYRGAVWQRS